MPNLEGTAWSQLEDCIEAARDALVPLYTSIPRQGHLGHVLNRWTTIHQCLMLAAL